MREYYELLGVSMSATDEEIIQKYNELRAKAKQDMWQDGEAGNEAARLLNKLDAAYNEIMSARKERSQTTTEGVKDVYEEIGELLKADKISEAQAKLDEFNERNAEWHYLQAVVFYKKNWTNDSKKQLEIAIQMDPNNVKYRSAYGKLNAKNEYQQQSANQQQTYNPYANAPMDEGDQMGGNACTECISCCYTTLCISCLFNLCCGCH